MHQNLSLYKNIHNYEGWRVCSQERNACMKCMWALIGARRWKGKKRKENRMREERIENFFSSATDALVFGRYFCRWYVNCQIFYCFLSLKNCKKNYFFVVKWTRFLQTWRFSELEKQRLVSLIFNNRQFFSEFLTIFVYVDYSFNLTR